MRPTITVCLLTYNREKSGYLKEALEAILHQIYHDIEIMVFDNHSNDDTSRLVLSYNDSRLLYIRQPPNTSPSTNYLSALWMARGEYVLITHDDDIMEPNMIQRMVDYIIQHPGLGLISTNVSLIDAHGKILQDRLYNFTEDRFFDIGEYTGVYLDEKLLLPTPTCMVRKDHTIATVSKEDTRATHHEYKSSGDIYQSCILNSHYPIAILADPLLRYRQHLGQESRNVDQSEPMYATMTALLQHKDKPWIQKHLPSIYGAQAKYVLQDELFVGESGESVYKEWLTTLQNKTITSFAELPINIFGSLMKYGICSMQIPFSEFKVMTEAKKTYLCWMELRYRDLRLFDALPQPHNIVIFGSMLTAYLLVLDAEASGHKVIACIDSSPQRIGKEVFGVPIMSHDSLKNMSDATLVVISSEREQELALKKIIEPILPNPDISIISWKDLIQ